MEQLDYLRRLGSIYKGSKFVKIDPYVEADWEGRQYDSSKDVKSTKTAWSRNALTLEQAIEWVEKGGRIGWIVPRGFVVVDVDNKEEPRSQEYIVRLLDKFEVKYSYNLTFHGIHILFSDPSNSIKNVVKEKCALNLIIDTRANEGGYIVLPCNDPHRSWGRLDDVTEDIPYFLKPIGKDSTASFIGMKNGDARNDALFRWRGVLRQRQKLSDEEIKKSIRIINENLFETPLENKELFQTVLREMDDKSSTKGKSKEDRALIFNNVAEEIVAKYNIISYRDTFYLWGGNYYRKINEVDIERLIHFDVSKAYSQAVRAEIISFIKIKTQVTMEQLNANWWSIACENGVVDLRTGELSEAKVTDYNTICIPHKYNPAAQSEKMIEFMSMITGGDLLKIEFLWQVMGYCLLKKNIYEKFFIFRGEGQTGKSTFVNILRRLLGRDNCCDLKLSQYDSEYYLIGALSKLVAIDGDAGETKTLKDTGMFKDFTSGNPVSAREIRQAVTRFEPFAKTIVLCNKLPKIADDSSGLYRRMIIVELNNVIPENKKDPQFMFKLTEEDYQYIFTKAVMAIGQVLERGSFAIMESESAILNKFKCRQSPLNEWLYECDVCAADIHNKHCVTLYNSFVMWCGDNGYTKFMTSYNFKEAICQYFNARIKAIRNENGGAPKQVFEVDENVAKDYKPFVGVDL